jgi:GTP-binding protein Era
VGKSTLLNALLGRKISIVSPKPQTTRNRIHGMLTTPDYQIIFADLPGLHTQERRTINRFMNRTALASLADADVNLLVVEALRWTEQDDRALAAVMAAGRPIILVINKVDRAQPRSRLLPFIAELSTKADFAAVLPLSALKRRNLDQLPALIARHLPESPTALPAGPAHGCYGTVHGGRDRAREAHLAPAG